MTRQTAKKSPTRKKAAPKKAARKPRKKAERPKPLTINKWLALPPAEEEITEIDGIKVLLQRVVEDKLDRLTDCNWCTKNYQSKYVTIGNRMFISASLELVVTYVPIPEIGQLGGTRTRTFVGAVTFDVRHFGSNLHLDNTAKSLCIVNAASELGRQFGRDLNPSTTPVITAQQYGEQNEGAVLDEFMPRKKSVKLKPDEKILSQYQQAQLDKDEATITKLESMYQIKNEG